MKKLLLIICNILIYITSFAQPSIATFSPASGVIGSSVTITGTGFNATANQNIVFFGATKATITAASTTSLTVTVPLGATYQYISVTNLATNLTAYSSQAFVVTLTGNTEFAPKENLLSGVRPISVSIGDLDGDGKPDLAVANYTSNSISVFRNISSSGAASFSTKVNFTTGDNPYSVSIGDLDGDGKPDLAVANYADNSVSVLKNTSTPGILILDPKVDFTTGSSPTSVKIGDIDSDGKPDLVVVNRFSHNVSVLLNTSMLGNINFAPRVNFSTGSSGNPRSVAIGDIDGDGKVDLAVPNVVNDNVAVLRNTSSVGSVLFAPSVNFTTGDFPRGASIGDIDGDGKVDLAVANYNSNTVSIFRNTSTSGTISFATKVDFATGNSPHIAEIGDIDGDGKADLATANYGSNTTSVLKNLSTPGTVTFASKVDFATDNQPKSVGIGDLDGDGEPDLVVTNYYINKVSVFRQITPPVISSFTPSSGCANEAAVVIRGSFFTGTTAVTFGGSNALNFTVDSATQITATVGSDSIGIIAVATDDGMDISTDTFTIKPLPIAGITLDGVVLSADSNGTSYQWINCSDNSTIPGATNQSYTATVNGDYAVIVTLNGCSDTSSCENVTDVGIINTPNSNVFSVYPNPFSTQATFDLSYHLNDATFIVYNSFGQQVKQVKNISTQTFTFHRGNLPNGLYSIHLIQDSNVIAIQKIVLID